jgi:hypothetical protein
MHTGLSPEWDRRFDEAFTELVSHDDEFVRAEFASLTRAAWPPRHRPHGRLPEPRDRHHDRGH